MMKMLYRLLKGRNFNDILWCVLAKSCIAICNGAALNHTFNSEVRCEKFIASHMHYPQSNSSSNKFLNSLSSKQSTLCILKGLSVVWKVDLMGINGNK
jgi:uncharacterized protein (DUF427 family)